MSRVVRSPWLLVVFVALLFGAPLWFACMRSTNTSLAATPPMMPMSQQQPPVSSTDLTDAMLRGGFDAKALTAIGLSANGVASFVNAFRDAYATQAPVVNAADTAFDSARVSSDALRRKIESGKGSGEDVTAYQAQMSAMNTAKASRDSALASARAPAEALLSQPQSAQLARIRANKTWELPMQFLLVDRTEVQWVALRDALANEKIAPRYGEQTSPENAAVLSAARSNPDVAQAKTRLDTNLTAVQAAINAAIVE
jgi:hypothetical protein